MSAFSITTDTKNLALSKRQYNEVIDMNKLQAVLKSKSVCNVTRKWWDEQHQWTGSEEDHEFERQYLEKLQKMLHYDKKYNKWYLKNVIYQGARKSEYGRVYPVQNLSLGVMRRPIRHFLCEDIYYDVDIINAHLELARIKCREFDLDHECIEYYCEHRDEVLQEIMTSTGQNRDFAKKCFIMMLNGGDWKRHFMRSKVKCSLVTDFIVKFHKEVKGIQKFLIEKYRNTLYKTLTDDTKTEKERLRSFMARYFQMIEVEILKWVLRMVSEEEICDIDKLVLAHDGFMIRKSYLDNCELGGPQEFIDYLNNVIETELEFPIKFKLKPFDEADEVKEQLKKEEIDWTEEYQCEFFKKYGCYRQEVKDIIGLDRDFAEAFTRMNENKYIATKQGNETVIYKLCKTGLYKKIKFEKLCKIFVEYMEEYMQEVEKDLCTEIKGWMGIYMEEEMKKLEKYYQEQGVKAGGKHLNIIGEKAKKRDVNMIEEAIKRLKKYETKAELAKKEKLKKVYDQAKKTQVVKNVCELLINQSFLEKCDTIGTLIGFNDGVLDLKTFEFRDARPEDNEFITMSCGYDFKEAYDDATLFNDKKEELRNMLKAMFQTEEKFIYVMKAISRCLCGGINREECAHFFKGVGSNGKSLIIDLIRYCLGEYAKELGYKFFCFENKGNIDVKLAECANARFIYVDEPPEKYVFNSDTFKNTTGNGEISCRQLYTNKMIRFVMPHLWFSANFTIKFNSDTAGNSMKRRVRGVEFPYKFTTNPKEVEENPDIFKLGDETLKDKIKDGYFNEAMMLLMIEYYKIYIEEGLRKEDMPEIIKKDTEGYLNEISKDKAWFDDTIELTTQSCYIDISELYELWKDETKTKKGLDYFKNKAKELFGKEAFSKQGVRCAPLWKWTSMDEEDIKKGTKIPKGGSRKRGAIRARFTKDYLLTSKSVCMVDEVDYGLDD